MAFDYEAEDPELLELRRRKLEEMQRRMQEEQMRKKLEEEAEARRQALLRSLLTEEARLRLANLRLVKPELAKAAEDIIIQLVQAGRLAPPVGDDVVKRILLELDARNRRDFKIEFKRK